MKKSELSFPKSKTTARTLADLLRPETIDDIVGQAALLGDNWLIRQMVNSGHLSNLLLWGPGMRQNNNRTRLGKTDRYGFHRAQRGVLGHGGYKKSYGNSKNVKVYRTRHIAVYRRNS